MLYIAPHARRLKPHLDSERELIHLTHYAEPEKLNIIRQSGLKPQIPEPATYCLAGEEIPPVYDWLRGRTPVKFWYPIDEVRVRPVILRMNAESKPVDERGISLDEYLTGTKLEPEFLWSLGVEFLVFGEATPENLYIK